MYKITDVTSLGKEYTVTTKDGNLLCKMQIILAEEILDATLGPYTDEFLTFNNYIEKSVAMLSGFEKIDSEKVLWYTFSNRNVVLADIVEYAYSYGYTTIILEYLEN